MILLDEKAVTLEFSDLLTRQPIHRSAGVLPRAPGAHQSDILSYIARKIGVLKPGERLEEEMPLVFALGFAWEEYMASFFPNMEWQPGELIVDGIAVNCDGITASDSTYGSDVMEEFKYTHKSTKTGDEFLQEWLYLHQGRAYCHCYGPRIERWHICHVRGDYKTFGPVFKQYVVSFTDSEVAQTWAMLLKNKDAAMAAKQAEEEEAVRKKLEALTV